LTSRSLRRGFAVPVCFAFSAIAVFVALGTWQMQRRTWKTALISTMEQRLSAAPVPVPPQSTWARLDRSEHEFERVTFSAKFARGTPARVYGVGSAMRTDVSGPGFWIFKPATLGSGGVVVLNRGFVPEARSAIVNEPPEGFIDFIGVLRWPEPRRPFVPADPNHGLWFTRDQLAMAAVNGWGDVAPFYVDLEAPLPPGGLPAPGPLRVNLRNEHFQYAITWYALAVAVVVMWMVWVKSRRSAA
jgi:surfeit locus 1 family protein